MCGYAAPRAQLKPGRVLRPVMGKLCVRKSRASAPRDTTASKRRRADGSIAQGLSVRLNRISRGRRPTRVLANDREQRGFLYRLGNVCVAFRFGGFGNRLVERRCRECEDVGARDTML